MNRNFSFYFLYPSESINVIMVDASIELVFEQVPLGVGGGGLGKEEGIILQCRWRADLSVFNTEQEL